MDETPCWKPQCVSLRHRLNVNLTVIKRRYARRRPCPSLSLSSISICDDVIGLSPKARNIGVILMDPNLTMEVQVTTICKSGFYYSRKINKIREYFSLKSAETLVHALVTSRLDFGNALLYGLSNTHLERIQKVQNAAARIVTLKRKRDHITPVLFKLHWLPIKERIVYKILLTTYKALSGLAPQYITGLLCTYRRNLRSSSDKKLVVPNYNLMNLMVDVLFLYLHQYCGIICQKM